MDWTDLTLKQFNQIKDIVLDPEYTEEDRFLYNIQIIFGVDPFKLGMNQLKYFTEKMGFLSQPIPKMKVKDVYKLGKNRYRLNKKLQDFTVAQFIDWRNMINEGGTESDNYANLLSVFLIPEGVKEYNEGYDIDSVRNDINEHLSIADAMALSAFFLTFRKALLIRSLLYSRHLTMQTKLPREKKRKVRKEYRKAIMAVLTGK